MMSYTPSKKLLDKIAKLPKWRLEKPRFVKETDDRHAGCVEQIRDCGFAGDELWSLYSVIIEFTLPRLVAYRENCPSEEELGPDVDKMIAAFVLIVDEEHDSSDENRRVVADGLDAFRANFLWLWN